MANIWTCHCFLVRMSISLQPDHLPFISTCLARSLSPVFSLVDLSTSFRIQVSKSTSVQCSLPFPDSRSASSNSRLYSSLFNFMEFLPYKKDHWREKKDSKLQRIHVSYFCLSIIIINLKSYWSLTVIKCAEHKKPNQGIFCRLFQLIGPNKIQSITFSQRSL